PFLYLRAVQRRGRLGSPSYHSPLPAVRPQRPAKNSRPNRRELIRATRIARVAAGDSPASLLRQFVARKKETQLKARRILSIGAMNRIVLDARCPLLANGAFLGVRRIRGAHQLSQVGNGIFFLQSQSDDGPARHEIGERPVEWPARMHRIKLFRLILGNLQHLHGENAEAILLELFNDVADRVLGDRVRFHDSKSALQGFHKLVVSRSSLVVEFLLLLGTEYKALGTRPSLPGPPPGFPRYLPEILPRGCPLLPWL